MPAERPTVAPRVAALLTSHNRRELTLACLERLFSQVGHNAEVSAVLLDAASDDGTAEAVRSKFEHVTVLDGHADLFWARGMHVAFSYAAEQGSYDFYLWLNDDTVLDPDALARLLATGEKLRADGVSASPVIVGATRDPDSGQVTYTGIERSDGRVRLRFAPVPPHDDEPRRVDTMNGNCVLLPADVVARVGLIDPTYFHALADFDYGLRVRAAGFSVWIAPGTVGTCRSHTLPDSRWLRVKSLAGPRRLRTRDWYTFARRWGGRWWPLLLPAPFIRHTQIAIMGERAEGNTAPKGSAQQGS